MSGQNLTAEQIAAAAGQQQGQNAGQSSAVQQSTGAVQQATGQQQQGQFIINQEQFNQRWGEKHAEIEKDLGMSIKDAKAFIEASKKPKPAAGEKLTGADLKLAKMTALMLAKVPSEKIPIALEAFNIAGNTSEEITASVQRLIDAKLLIIEAPAAQQGTQQQQNQIPNAAQGAGNPGVQNQQPQQKKIWKESEIRELRLQGKLTDEIMTDIRQAATEGRVQ